MLNARCLSFSHDQSRRSPRFASSSPGSRHSGLACRFKKSIAGSSVFCGSFGDLPIDPELTRPFSPFFCLKAHFLFETARDLGLQGFQMAILARAKLSWFD
jgi:hypothetical protein